MSNLDISPKNPLPTDFTVAVGQRIRQAREERGLSQMELANRIARRQAAVSDMERGQMEPDTTTLVMLAKVLEKPVTYFFPAPWYEHIETEDLTDEEYALLLSFRRLRSEEYREIVIHQLAAFIDFQSKKS